MFSFQSSHVKQDCIESCSACESICLEAVSHCRQDVRLRGDQDLMAVLAVCADICATSARALAGGSSVHLYTCRACAAVCEQLATLCANYPGDALLRACASACVLAARSCTDMARASGL